MGMFSLYLQVTNLSYSVKTLGKKPPNCIERSTFSCSGTAFWEDVLIFFILHKTMQVMKSCAINNRNVLQNKCSQY